MKVWAWQAVGVALAVACGWAGAADPAEAGATAPVSAAGLTAAAPQWQAVGPEGGYFKEIVISPKNPQVVFAGSDDSGGIWKSTNGGDDWRLTTGNLRNATGWWIQFDPSNPDVMYAADIYGRHPLLKSTDAGETWQDIGDGIPFRRTSCVAVDPKNPSTLYVGTGFGDDRPGDGLFKTTDGGKTWSRAGHEGKTVYTLCAHPSGAIFAGTQDGLFRTSDGAKNWERVGGGFPETGVGAITLTPDGTLYAGSTGPKHSLYKSDAAGQTWTGLGLPMVIVWDIAVEPGANGQVIYCGAIAGAHAVYKTEDGGKTWTPQGEGIRGKWAIGMAQGADKTLYCSNFTNKGIYRSRDGAKTWHEANRKLYGFFVTGMTLDPSDPTRFIVTGLGPYTADPNAVGPVTWEGKADGGMDWRLLNDLDVQTYAPSICPADSKTILYGSFLKGVYFSRNGGADAKNIYDKGICLATAFDPDDPRVAMASVLELNPLRQFILRTGDGGETWTQVPVEFSARELQAEKGTQTVWAAGSTGIFVSRDNGLTWSKQGLEGQEILSLAQHPSKPAVLLAGGRKTAFHRSDDGGATWVPVEHPAWPEECDVYRLAFDPTDSQRFYVGLGGAEIHVKEKDHDGWRGGVWTSPDLGRTWADLTGNLNNDHTWALQPTPDGRTLYVGTYGGGVYRLNLPSK